MFIAALVDNVEFGYCGIAKMWKQPECTSHEWINKLWHTHTYGVLLSLKEEGNSVTCYNMDEP